MAAKAKAARFDRACEMCGDMMYGVLERKTTCSACVGVKNDAFKAESYGAALEAMAQAHEAGEMGQAVRDAGTAAIAAYQNARQAGALARYEQERTRKAAQRAAGVERAATNAFLKEHGYRWIKVGVGTEDDWAGPGSLGAGIGEVDYYQWELVGPDGRTVTVAEARAQIAATTLAKEAV